MGKYWLFLKNLKRKINVMDKIWDRKSFKVGGHWPLWRGWKNEWPSRTDKIRMLIFFLNDMRCIEPTQFSIKLEQLFNCITRPLRIRNFSIKYFVLLWVELKCNFLTVFQSPLTGSAQQVCQFLWRCTPELVCAVWYWPECHWLCQTCEPFF